MLWWKPWETQKKALQEIFQTLYRKIYKEKNKMWKRPKPFYQHASWENMLLKDA